MTEAQFHALELWVLAAAHRAAQTWPTLSSEAYERRRDEAKALLCATPPRRTTMPNEALGPDRRIALDDSHGSVKGYFIIVQDPGCVPDKKRPPTPTAEGAERMLCELHHHRPEARLTLVELTWDDDLWVGDGVEHLTFGAAGGGITLPDQSIASLRLRERGWDVWVKSPGRRHAHKASGPFERSRDAVREICGPIWRAALKVKEPSDG